MLFLKIFVMLVCVISAIALTLCFPLNATTEDITMKSMETDADRFKCSMPDITANSTDVNQTRLNIDYKWISEVKFPGVVGPLKEKLICKLKCIDGSWVGPLCSDTEDGRYQPIFRECSMDDDQPRLFVSFRNETIKNGTKFAHGSVLRARCKDFGLFKLVGENAIECRNGVWTSKLPTCVPTTKITNFTEDAPPSIIVEIPSGSASIEPSGDLYVYPESIVRLNCVVLKKWGNPEWSWTTKYGDRKIDWYEEVMETEIHYKLKLDRVQGSDSGIYSCATRMGTTNSISIQVVSIHCVNLEVNYQYLTHWSEGNKLGQSVRFSCPTGYTLVGNAKTTCQGSGRWSSPVPTCVTVECPPISRVAAHLRLTELERSAGGRAVFSCEWGYRLNGHPGIECGDDGHWSGSPPLCEAIHCPTPLVPENGYMIDGDKLPSDKQFFVGDLVQFDCIEPHTMKGEASIVCTESGVWSHPPPFCNSDDYDLLATEDYIRLLELEPLNDTIFSFELNINKSTILIPK